MTPNMLNLPSFEILDEYDDMNIYFLGLLGYFQQC